MIHDNVELGDASQNLIQEDKLQLHTLYGQARLQFIQKVFALLGLICTVAMILLMIYFPSFYAFQQGNTFLFIICVVGWLVSYFLIVYRRMNRQYPKNIVLLVIYTIGQSYSVSYLCGAYLVSDFKNILFIAAMMTLGIVIGCMIYAYKTKNDFTTNQGAKIIGGISVTMLLVFVLSENQNLMTILVCTLATALYGMHLIINIQVMIGSNERMLSVDDFMICAVELYTNILQLFTCILVLLTSKRNR